MDCVSSGPPASSATKAERQAKQRKGAPAAPARGAFNKAAAEEGARGAAGAATADGRQATAPAPLPRASPPPVVTLAFRRAEPAALAGGLVEAVRGLEQQGDVDRGLALRWL